MNSLARQMKIFTPLLQGLLVCAALAAGADKAFGEKSGSDFSPRDRKLIVSILRTLGPLIKDRQTAGRAPLLRWSELAHSLNNKQRLIIRNLRQYSGAAGDDEDPSRQPLVRLDDQYIRTNGQATAIPPQYVTPAVYDAYTRMSQDMQKDLGTALRIESGYRSPAYQLYLFLSHLPRYRFNIAKTSRHVALPGRSEHGSLHHLAIDLINAEGINGDDNPRNFSVLPEYRWMTLHAKEYGFGLSFQEPTIDSAFEPWHWRHRQ
ncbi:MAG: D-alanyl-D-alanine carboxypeptidase family protein [Deltaproteobacteria bacterium]|nr:D-alanyl-D-alanine carboxypeptidase family protein [Deltaproteobacteria bacterium]